MRSLATRVTVHSIAPVAAFAVVLCLSAGTLPFWQARAYLATSLATMTATNVYFLRASAATLERRLAVAEEREHYAGQRRIIQLVALSTVAMLVVAGADHRIGWSRVASTVLAAAYRSSRSIPRPRDGRPVGHVERRLGPTRARFIPPGVSALADFNHLRAGFDAFDSGVCAFGGVVVIMSSVWAPGPPSSHHCRTRPSFTGKLHPVLDRAAPRELTLDIAATIVERHL